MTSGLVVASVLTIAAMLISIPANAGAREVEKCRATAGKPTFHACIRGGGDHDSCKERSSFAVKRCLASNPRGLVRCKALALERGLTLSRSDRGARHRFILDCKAGRVN
jgi:hypothetical protein